MTLSEIATISGKGGLFKVVAPTKSGIVLESLDATKTKLVTSASQRLSLLHEISIYTTTREGTVALESVLKAAYTKYKESIPVNGDSAPESLKAFMKDILPEFDSDRVYVSDMRKFVKWYGILLVEAPEVFGSETEESSPAPAETE